MRCLIFLHGFASSPNTPKAHYLRSMIADQSDAVLHAPDFSPTPADFEYLTVTGMINRLRQYILERELADFCLIGSSLGGLVALHYAHRFGGATRLLLLAPALTYLSGERVGMPLKEWQAAGVGDVFHHAFNRMTPLRYDLELDGRLYQTAPPPPAPLLILHGRQDEIVSIAASRAYVRAHPAQTELIELEAGHDLNPHLALIGATAQRFCLV
jgi:uncharacterized protein